MTPDERQFYNLEAYLFDEVGPRWRQQGWLSPLDFFAIVVWKSNRAKTKIRTRMLEHAGGSLEDAVRQLTSALAVAPDLRAAFSLLIAEWGFRLPMASAVLTVLRPDEATIYDARACAELKNFDPSWQFDRLVTLTRFDAFWAGYVDYVRAVRAATPDGLSLRDKDRWLWGRSFHRDLEALVADGRAPRPVS